MPEAMTAAKTTRGIVGRLLRLTWDYRRRAALLVGLQLGLIVLTLMALGLTGLAIDVLGSDDPSKLSTPWGFARLPALPSEAIVWIGGLILALAVGRALLNHAHSVQAARLVHEEVVARLRLELYDHLQHLGLRFFAAHDGASLVQRLTRDVQMLRSFIDGVVIQGTVLILTLTAFAGYMFSQHVGLTLATLVLTPVLYLVTLQFLRTARPAYQEERRLADRLLITLSETIEGIQVVKTFGREAPARAEFETRNQDLREHQRDIFRMVSRFIPTIDGLTQTTVLVLIGYGSWLLSRGDVSLGDLVVFAALLGQFGSRVSEMAGIANTLQQSITGARRVFEVFDAEPEVKSPRGGRRLSGKSHGISLEGVSFGYDERLVLDEITLEVPAGRRIALVGPTGSGKSSLLWLIPRFYDPRAGTVRIDGLDARELDLRDLRRRIGIVPQDGFLFHDTIAANIAFGAPDADRDRIERAAQRAGAHEFIERLERGYDTILAEGAVDLSGGQRQRLTLARALLLDPPILLLDDPLAAVDPITAASVQASIEEATRGHTTFIVGTRSGLLKCVDEVAFLEHGRLTSVENSSALLPRFPAGASLFRRDL